MVFVEGLETYFYLFIPLSDEPLIDTIPMMCKIVNISSCCCHGYYDMVVWGPVKACVWAWTPQKVDLLYLLLSNNKKEILKIPPTHLHTFTRCTKHNVCPTELEVQNDNGEDSQQLAKPPSAYVHYRNIDISSGKQLINHQRLMLDNCWRWKKPQLFTSW